MTGGPSKQELEMYWQNSRQYFDELAKHYQQADPKYYKEYILPFYSNPFRSKTTNNDHIYTENVSHGRNKSGAPKAALFVAMIVVAGIGAVMYFVMGTSTNERSYQKDPVVIEKPVVADTTSTVEETKVEKPASPDYVIGKKYYMNKQYDMAEKRLKRIPSGSPDYDNAQELLEKLRSERKEEHNKDSKNNEERLNNKQFNEPKTGNDRNRRPAPVQPVR